MAYIEDEVLTINSMAQMPESVFHIEGQQNIYGKSRLASIAKSISLKGKNQNQILDELKRLPKSVKLYRKMKSRNKTLGMEVFFYQPIALQLDNKETMTGLDLKDNTIQSRKQYFASAAAREVGPSLHYVDDEQLRGNYYTEDSGMRATEMHVEVTQADTSGLVAELFNKFGGEIRRESIKKIIATLSSRKRPANEIYKNLLGRLVNDRAIIGLEVIDPSDIDNRPLELLEEESKEMERKGWPVDEAALEQKKIQAKRQSVAKSLNNLSGLGSKDKEVLINGEFLITKADSGEYTLTYEHPLSQYYNNTVRIVTLPIPKILSPFDNAYQDGKFKDVSIYGKVHDLVNISNDRWNLGVEVIALH